MEGAFVVAAQFYFSTASCAGHTEPFPSPSAHHHHFRFWMHLRSNASFWLLNTNGPRADSELRRDLGPTCLSSASSALDSLTL